MNRFILKLAPGQTCRTFFFHQCLIFRVTTPSAAACAPDIYQEHFKAWVTAFDQHDNPILIPEARSDARAAQQCWYTSQATRGFGKLTGGTEDEACETPAFAALVKMGENDLLVVGKTMRVVLQRAGYRLKAWEKGQFRDHQWVAEQPLDVPQDDAKTVISLTEAPKSLDLVRVKFEKR